MALLKLQNVRKYYEQKLVLDVPEIEFESNRKYSIVGPNGSGKSTLLNILAILDKPTQGDVFFNGENIWKSSKNIKYFRDNFVLVLQQPFLFNTTVFNNVSFGLKLKSVAKNEIKKRVVEILEKVGLKNFDNRNARKLSGGEMQRVAIACAAVLKPNVLLLDEPTSNLDKTGTFALEKIIENLNATVILTTQNIEQAYRLNSKPLSIVNSKIVLNSIDNLFFGEISSADNLKTIAISEKVSFSLVSEKVGNSHVFVDPAAIIVSNQQLQSSARNNFKGKILQIIDKLNHLKLIIQIEDVEISALITKDSFYEMNLKFDVDVYLTFKASAVQVY